MAALQLQLHVHSSSRRSAKYEATTWDYDSITHELLLPLPLGRGSQQEKEEAAAAAADDAIANHLHLLVATSNTDIISSSEMESVQASLKNTVRRMLLVLQEEEDDDDRSRSMLLLRTIHQLQSLGIAYHFDQEIRTILLSMHHRHHDLDLHSAALLFRMLRQLGIPASTDMLTSALREEDHKVVAIDRDGLLALYQASYLGFPGETALDQARAFAVDKLLLAAEPDGDSDCTTHLPSPLPLHWTAPRLQAMWSLKLKDDDDHNNNRVAVVDPAILQLAQIDFHLVQALHRRELAEVTTWWKESRLCESSFARDRVVECFFCAACIAPEPRLAESREVLAKTGALIVHLDDIYDVYGTMDELQAFTDAIASWEEHCDDVVMGMAALPEYMKAMFSAICTTSAAAADGVLERHGYDDMLPLYKKAWHELCKAFLVEAQWQQQGYMPTFAEYVNNGWVTSTGPLLLLHALPAAGIPIIITQMQANNGDGAGGGIDYPRLVELSSTIFRLCNDCASHQAESERGDAPSSIACCMAEPWCAGEKEARATVQGVIAETWKLLNREVVAARCSSSAAETESMTMTANLCLNLARIIHCIYQDGDGITSPTHRMKQMVKDLLFNHLL